MVSLATSSTGTGAGEDAQGPTRCSRAAYADLRSASSRLVSTSAAAASCIMCWEMNTFVRAIAPVLACTRG